MNVKNATSTVQRHIQSPLHEEIRPKCNKCDDENAGLPPSWAITPQGGAIVPQGQIGGLHGGLLSPPFTCGLKNAKMAKSGSFCT